MIKDSLYKLTGNTIHNGESLKYSLQDQEQEENIHYHSYWPGSSKQDTEGRKEEKKGRKIVTRIDKNQNCHFSQMIRLYDKP